MTERRTVEDGIERIEYESDNYRGDIKRAEEERLRPAPSCLKCIHFKMCVITKNVYPMVGNLFGMLEKKDMPFQPDEIAKLCRWYETETVTERVEDCIEK